MNTLNHIKKYGMIEDDINKFLKLNNLNINRIININNNKKEFNNGYCMIFHGSYTMGHYTLTLIKINNNECYFLRA